MGHKAHHIDVDLPLSHGLLVRIILTCAVLVLVWGGAMVLIFYPTLLAGTQDKMNTFVADLLGSADTAAQDAQAVDWEQRMKEAQNAALELLEGAGELLEAPTVPEDAVVQ